MKILGIDPGTGRMGWGILEIGLRSQNSELSYKRSEKRVQNRVLRSEVNLEDCGCLETKANTPLPDRLEYIYGELNKIIKKYKPRELAIEELFFVKNVKTGMSVAHARGVAILVAKQANLEIYEYKPNEIKVAITGYGHADKDQIRKMLKLHLKGCNIKQDDAADAVAVALTHQQMAKGLSAIRNQQ